LAGGNTSSRSTNDLRSPAADWISWPNERLSAETTATFGREMYADERGSDDEQNAAAAGYVTLHLQPPITSNEHYRAVSSRAVAFRIRPFLH